MNRFKYHRKRAGLTQTEAARRLAAFAPGRAALRASIAQWENGYAKPEIDMLIPLADVYGCTVDELLREDREENDAFAKERK
jgi:transcriptional regulator with XRE-family HTH domain